MEKKDKKGGDFVGRGDVDAGEGIICTVLPCPFRPQPALYFSSLRASKSVRAVSSIQVFQLEDLEVEILGCGFGVVVSAWTLVSACLWSPSG